MNDNVQISINAMQQRLTTLETEVIIGLSKIERLEAENQRLQQELEQAKQTSSTDK